MSIPREVLVGNWRGTHVASWINHTLADKHMSAGLSYAPRDQQAAHSFSGGLFNRTLRNPRVKVVDIPGKG